MTTFHPAVASDFTTMDDDALAAAVSTLAAHIHAATGRLLALIAELDRREVWAAQGALSCAHWLSWACGIDTHTAREKVRVVRSSTAPPSRRRPLGGCAATPESSPSSMDPTASRSVSGDAPATFRPRYAERLQAATAGAASPAAPPLTASTAITSGTGPTAKRPRSTTSSCSARPTIASCTRAGSTCSASTTARSGLPIRTGWPSGPRGGR